MKPKASRVPASGIRPLLSAAATAVANNPGVTVQKVFPAVGSDTVTLTLPLNPGGKTFARLKVWVTPQANLPSFKPMHLGSRDSIHQLERHQFHRHRPGAHPRS